MNPCIANNITRLVYLENPQCKRRYVPFKDRSATVTKDAAVIDNEVWAFGIDATPAEDIVAAVKLASRYYDIKPRVLLKDVYAKNLNAEKEDTMPAEVLIKANKDLYANTCKALIFIRHFSYCWSTHCRYRPPVGEIFPD